MQVDLTNYKNMYLQTSKEYLDKIQIDLDKLFEDPLDKTALGDLHVSSHSLRGESQVMKFTEIYNLCMGIESAARNALETSTQLNSQAILDMKETLGNLRKMVRKIEDGSISVQSDTENAKI